MSSDSFSDGGKYTSVDAALQQKNWSKKELRSWISEENQPNLVDPLCEIQKIGRVGSGDWKPFWKESDVLISVDTGSPRVAAAAQSWSNIVNDITGFLGDSRWPRSSLSMK